MSTTQLQDRVGPALARALEQKGYLTLTPVQEAVLAPELAGRDVRLSSQTGSGKTVAIGLLLRETVERHAAREEDRSPPRALIVTPTRELAKQVELELTWLLAPYSVRVVSLTGGASYRDERRALAASPGVVVGTPGRLLDHLEKGALDPSGLECVVLDEADRMLDLGFRDDILAIFARAPSGRRTHLVSATFPREVQALADSVQEEPREVFGTPLGAANLDIEHVVHLVEARERFDSLVNLLLAHPDEQMLVFARTRADVAGITSELLQAGFVVSSLSGEMEQAERNRALAAFRTGRYRALIATDVAARGIDVAGISRVVHYEPPADRDSYTHRSGRTGRAGRKGTSSVLVTPAGLARTLSLLSRLGIEPRFEPVPGPAEIRELAGARSFDDLVADDAEDAAGFEPSTWSLAKRLAAHPTVARVIARLLVRSGQLGPTKPRELHPPEPRGFGKKGPRAGSRDSRTSTQDWVSFEVSFGAKHGADARRLLALSCRRGRIRGAEVGAIRIFPEHSLLDVDAKVAEDFAERAMRPDPREPHVRFRRLGAARAKDPRASHDGPSGVRGPRERGAGARRPAGPREHDRARSGARPAWSPEPHKPGRAPEGGWRKHGAPTGDATGTRAGTPRKDAWTRGEKAAAGAKPPKRKPKSK